MEIKRKYIKVNICLVLTNNLSQIQFSKGFCVEHKMNYDDCLKELGEFGRWQVPWSPPCRPPWIWPPWPPLGDDHLPGVDSCGARWHHDADKWEGCSTPCPLLRLLHRPGAHSLPLQHPQLRWPSELQLPWLSPWPPVSQPGWELLRFQWLLSLL